MGAIHVPLADIEDPLEAAGWRVSRPDDEGTLHAEVLRELCDRALALHVGAAGTDGTKGTLGVTATLQFVDLMQNQIVLASYDDGIAVARALQARPVWAAALLRGLRVQFVLAAACAARERSGRHIAGGEPDERFLIQARWPREIYRTSRRQAARLAPGRAAGAAAATAVSAPVAALTPVVRFCGGHHLVSTRNLRVLDISELGCAVVLPAGMVPPPAGSSLRGVELELDEAQLIVTDARVLHVAACGRSAHRLGCRWENLSGAGKLALRRWLAAAGQSAQTARSAQTAHSAHSTVPAAQGLAASVAPGTSAATDVSAISAVAAVSAISASAVSAVSAAEHTDRALAAD